MRGRKRADQLGEGVEIKNEKVGEFESWADLEVSQTWGEGEGQRSEVGEGKRADQLRRGWLELGGGRAEGSGENGGRRQETRGGKSEVDGQGTIIKKAGRPMWSPRLRTFLIRSMVA